MTTSKLTPEEEYFAREELAKLKRLADEKREKLAHEEKAQLKAMHWMHCPKCGASLHEVLFRGVTIDKCFECRGVFLDSPEFEKLAGKESGFFQSFFSLFKSR